MTPSPRGSWKHVPRGRGESRCREGRYGSALIEIGCPESRCRKGRYGSSLRDRGRPASRCRQGRYGSSLVKLVNRAENHCHHHASSASLISNSVACSELCVCVDVASQSPTHFYLCCAATICASGPPRQDPRSARNLEVIAADTEQNESNDDDDDKDDDNDPENAEQEQPQ